MFGEVQSVCHPFATRKNKKDVMKEERVNMLNNQHVRPYICYEVLDCVILSKISTDCSAIALVSCT